MAPPSRARNKPFDFLQPISVILPESYRRLSLFSCLLNEFEAAEGGHSFSFCLKPPLPAGLYLWVPEPLPESNLLAYPGPGDFTCTHTWKQGKTEDKERRYPSL